MVFAADSFETKAKTRGATGSWQRRLSASKLILLLTTALLVVMPVTEHFCSWDQFLSGGHDFEFTLLGALIFCGLVALMPHQVVTSTLLLLMIARPIVSPRMQGLFSFAWGKARSKVQLCCSERSSSQATPPGLVPLRV